MLCLLIGLQRSRDDRGAWFRSYRFELPLTLSQNRNKYPTLLSHSRLP